MKTENILKIIIIICIILIPFAAYNVYITKKELDELHDKIKQMEKPINYDSIRIKNWKMDK